MKSLNTLRAAVAVATLACTGAFAQVASTTLNVSATVSSVCRFSSAQNSTTALTGPVTFTFSAIDPTAASGNSTGSVTLNYRCNNTSIPALSVGGTTTSPRAGTLTGPGGATMAYELSWTAPGASAGDITAALAQQVVINGTILNATYANKAAGAYTETGVAVTLTP